jgi:hypothetical protein
LVWLGETWLDLEHLWQRYLAEVRCGKRQAQPKYLFSIKMAIAAGPIYPISAQNPLRKFHPG